MIQSRSPIERENGVATSYRYGFLKGRCEQVNTSLVQALEQQRITGFSLRIDSACIKVSFKAALPLNSVILIRIAVMVAIAIPRGKTPA